MTWVDDVLQKRLAARLVQASGRAEHVLATMAQKGIQARIVGSLAEGRFRLHSDVDFLIESCPDALRYSIEATVEDIMEDIPFDVIYQDEIISPIQDSPALG